MWRRMAAPREIKSRTCWRLKGWMIIIDGRNDRAMIDTFSQSLETLFTLLDFPLQHMRW